MSTGNYSHLETATCTAWLPKAYGVRDYPAIYRFEPGDGYEYQQYGYTYLDLDGDGGAAKEWVDLGRITLARAITNSFTLAAAATTFIYYLLL